MTGGNWVGLWGLGTTDVEILTNAFSVVVFVLFDVAFILAHSKRQTPPRALLDKEVNEIEGLKKQITELRRRAAAFEEDGNFVDLFEINARVKKLLEAQKHLEAPSRTIPAELGVPCPASIKIVVTLCIIIVGPSVFAAEFQRVINVIKLIGCWFVASRAANRIAGVMLNFAGPTI